MTKNLRVLIYSNPLVVDKISKRFIYWRDSGFIFTKNLIKRFPSDSRFYWLVPDKLKEMDYKWFLSANENIELIPYPYSTSIHQNRYEFYGDVLRKSFPYTKDVDVIINNQPEVSAGLWNWAYNQRRDLPILMSFFHWIDCDESRKFAKTLGGYFWRQYEGSILSDAIYLHGEYAKSLFKKEVKHRGVDDSDINYKFFFPPPTKFGNEPIDLPDKKIILFNHRLNNTTNWRGVVDRLKDLFTSRQDFVLWITDENRNLSAIKELKELPFVIIREIPDKSYGFLINNCHFSVCNHKGYSTWNMAILDAMENGAFTIVPKDDVYISMFRNIESKWGIFHNRDDLLDMMNNLLDMPIEKIKDKWRREKKYIQPIYNHLDGVVLDIESFIRKRIDSRKIPKKYGKVKDMILKSDGVSKRDWVNEFWSFHANSNFQIIRWMMLNNGIFDDTSKSESVYFGEKLND